MTHKAKAAGSHSRIRSYNRCPFAPRSAGNKLITFIISSIRALLLKPLKSSTWCLWIKGPFSMYDSYCSFVGIFTDERTLRDQ